MSVMTEPEVSTHVHKAGTRRKRAARVDPEQRTISMRDLTKLTKDDLERLTEPVPITSAGIPVAWLIPMTPGERRRAEMIAAGELEPAKRGALAGWQPLQPLPGERPLSEILLEMRDLEHT